MQFQEFFRTELIKTAAQRGIPVPARAILSATEKELRILSLQPYVTNAQIQLHQSQAVLVEQLRHWPESDHDDGPDALNMLWMLASTSTAGIPKIISGPRPYSNGFTGAHQYGNN